MCGCFCVFVSEYSHQTLNVCVDLQTLAQLGDVIWFAERNGSFHMTGLKDRWRKVVPVSLTDLCVCVCICTSILVCIHLQVLICFHKVQCRHMSICYYRLVSTRKREVLKFAMWSNTPEFCFYSVVLRFKHSLFAEIKPPLINSQLHIWKKAKLCYRLGWRFCLQLSVYTSLIIRALFWTNGPSEIISNNWNHPIAWALFTRLLGLKSP